MDFKNELARFRKDIDSSLADFFSHNNSYPGSVGNALKILQEFTLRGGKRIRPALVYYGYRCFSDEDLGEVLKASMVMELVQSYLLIHDDIIDMDSTRRGGPTVHVQFDDPHMGVSMAIVIGDIACALAVRILNNAKLDEAKKSVALKVLNDCVFKVITGQIMDVAQDLNSIADVLKMYELKTAAYTFEGPLLIGASLAGASGKDKDILSKIAVPLGKAFQLQDDLLDLFGDSKLGKPIGSDIKEGKKTLLILKALEGASDPDKEFLNSILGKDFSADDLERIRSILTDTGAKAFVEKKCAVYLDQAKYILESSKFRCEGKDFLIGLCEYLRNRSY